MSHTKEDVDTAWSAGMLEGRKLGIESERKGTLAHVRRLARMTHAEMVERNADGGHRVPHVLTHDDLDMHRAALMWLANELSNDWEVVS